MAIQLIPYFSRGWHKLGHVDSKIRRVILEQTLIIQIFLHKPFLLTTFQTCDTIHLTCCTAERNKDMTSEPQYQDNQGQLETNRIIISRERSPDSHSLRFARRKTACDGRGSSRFAFVAIIRMRTRPRHRASLPHPERHVDRCAHRWDERML